MQTKPISFRTKYYVIASVAWQSPGRDTILQTHARYFCTCVEKKAHTSIRVSVIACDNVISKAQLSGTPRDTCTRGEKAHTSKRVSVIACENAISNVQCAPWGIDNTTAVAVVLSFDVF